MKRERGLFYFFFLLSLDESLPHLEEHDRVVEERDLGWREGISSFEFFFFEREKGSSPSARSVGRKGKRKKNIVRSLFSSFSLSHRPLAR